MKNKFNFKEVLEAVAKLATDNDFANVLIIKTSAITDSMFCKLKRLLELEQYNDIVSSSTFYVMEYLPVTWQSFSEIKNEEDEHWLYKIANGKLEDYI